MKRLGRGARGAGDGEVVVQPTSRVHDAAGRLVARAAQHLHAAGIKYIAKSARLTLRIGPSLERGGRQGAATGGERTRSSTWASAGTGTVHVWKGEPKGEGCMSRGPKEFGCAQRFHDPRSHTFC